MSFVISSLLPFPNILWWSQVLGAEEVVWDQHEYFEKMTYRNRYYIKGSGGLLKLSLPIAGGREHKSHMKDVRISGTSDWRKQHWRTIFSAYGNAPYFEYYGEALGQLFAGNEDSLGAFSLASVHWVKQQMLLDFREGFSLSYQRIYEHALADLRSLRPGMEQGSSPDFPAYYQLFQERAGFLPNLSILDLLFAEGPHAAGWLKVHRERVLHEADIGTR